MNMETVRILQIEPYHKIYGLLIPQLAQRLMEGLAALGDDNVLPQFMSRLWLRDPGVLLLAAIDSAGQIKGYTAAMHQAGSNEIVFLQPRMDEPTENDAVAEMIDWIERWSNTFKAEWLTLIARRVDAKWSKRFGFEVTRYILQREVK